MDNKSLSIIIAKLEKALRTMIEDVEAPETKGNLNFE